MYFCYSSQFQVTVTGLTINDIVLITYTYLNYSTTELDAYIESALDYINIYADKSFEFESADALTPVPTLREKALIAIVASIIINPNYIEYSLPILKVKYPVKMTKEEKIEGLTHSYYYNTDGTFALIEVWNSGESGE